MPARSRNYCSQCGRLKRRGEDCPICRGDEELYCPECEIDVKPEDSSCSFCGARFYADVDEREVERRDARIRQEQDEELVCIKKTTSGDEARMIGAMLESYGVWTLVKAGDIGGAYPGASNALPAVIFVRRRDEKEARQLLEEPTPPASRR